MSDLRELRVALTKEPLRHAYTRAIHFALEGRGVIAETPLKRSLRHAERLRRRRERRITGARLEERAEIAEQRRAGGALRVW